MTQSVRLYVDADACPVKDEIARIGEQYGVPVIFVASYAHMTDYPGEWVFVDAKKEEVDMYIVNHTRPKDIVVTQDHGLASLLSARQVYILSPTGIRYTEKDMAAMLWARHVSAKQRRAGGRTKGPRKFTAEDRQIFGQELIKILQDVEGESSSLSNN